MNGFIHSWMHGWMDSWQNSCVIKTNTIWLSCSQSSHEATTVKILSQEAPHLEAEDMLALFPQTFQSPELRTTWTYFYFSYTAMYLFIAPENELCHPVIKCKELLNTVLPESKQGFPDWEYLEVTCQRNSMRVGAWGVQKRASDPLQLE